MALPKWSTPERRTHLLDLVDKYKGVCLKGHKLCPELDHYVETTTKFERIKVRGRKTSQPYFPTHPITAADVREGRAIAPYCHGIGVVELAHAVSGGALTGPKRVPVQHEELSDLYGRVEEQVIADWKQDDRDQRRADRKLWGQAGPTGEVGRFGVFHDPMKHATRDAIDMEGFFENRPKYYLLGYSVDNKLRRFARVRIPGTNIQLKVDVTNSIQGIKSEKKRKWLRKQGVRVVFDEILIREAVDAWWLATP